MKKLILQQNKDTYEIIPFTNSTWCEVKLNNNRIALVMDEGAAFQVVHFNIKKTGDCKFLQREDFTEVET